jgi:hypothetical protein
MISKRAKENRIQTNSLCFSLSLSLSLSLSPPNLWKEEKTVELKANKTRGEERNFEGPSYV